MRGRVRDQPLSRNYEDSGFWARLLPKQRMRFTESGSLPGLLVHQSGAEHH